VRGARLLLAVALVSGIACRGDRAATPPSSTDRARTVAIPRVPVPGLHHSDATLDPASATVGVAHPDDMLAALHAGGSLGVAERTYAGGHGTFSRVVVRAFSFGSPQGAAGFLAWLRSHGADLIGTATPLLEVAVPEGVSLSVHEPSGCCHREVPGYLAAWQRGLDVWTIQASGPMIRTRAVVELVAALDQEV